MSGEDGKDPPQGPFEDSGRGDEGAGQPHSDDGHGPGWDRRAQRRASKQTRKQEHRLAKTERKEARRQRRQDCRAAERDRRQAQRERQRARRRRDRAHHKARHRQWQAQHAAWHRKWRDTYLPLGMASRIILIIAFVLALSQIISWLFSNGPGEVTEMVYARQIAAAVELLDVAPEAQREKIAEAMSGPGMTLSLSPRAPDVSLDMPKYERDAMTALAYLQQRLGDRPFVIGLDFRRGDFDAVLGAPLMRQDWAVFRLPPDEFENQHQDDLWTAAFWILLGLVIVWSARRIARPIRQFADAAERLGRDMNAPPLHIKGSKEIRRAAAAFNEMAERIRRLIDDRTLMLAAISHDLRTVLTRLRLRAEFIEDPEQREKAEHDIEEMQAMLTAGLAFARGETEVEPRETCDLAQMLEELCQYEREAGQQARYTGPASCAYRCGPSEMRRSFANLIRNAIAYGGSADVVLERDAEGVVITVADHGPGIPPEQLETVFQPFFRVEASRNRSTGGSGLGLSIARTIVLRHGGEIRLENRDEGGLQVIIDLPSTD